MLADTPFYSVYREAAGLSACAKQKRKKSRYCPSELRIFRRLSRRKSSRMSIL